MMRERLQSTKIRVGLAFLKLVVVPMAISWVIFTLPARGPMMSIDLRPGWLVAGIVAIQVALWLVSVRLVQLLAIYGAPLRFLAALRINLQSGFYFLVLPTQAGMEAVRFVGLRASLPMASSGTIASTLLFDRLFGALAAAILFAGSAAVILPGRLQSISLRLDAWTVVTALLILGLLVGGAVAATISIRRSDRIAALLRPLIVSWRQLLIIFFSAVLAQALVVAGVACALLGLGLEVPVMPLAFGIMGGNFLMLIPISVAGLGPAELGGAALLIAAGMAQPFAILAVFVTYLTRVLAGLQGAVIEVWEGGMALRRIVSLRLAVAARPPDSRP